KVKEPVGVRAVLKIARALFWTITEPDPLTAPLNVTLLDLDIVIDPLLVMDSASALAPVYDCETSKAAPFAIEMAPALSAPPASAKTPALMVRGPLGLLGPPESVPARGPPILSDLTAPEAFTSRTYVVSALEIVTV